MRAEDEPLLKGMTRAMLDEYIAGAPASQQGVPERKFWKFARKPNATNSEALLDSVDDKNCFAAAIDRDSPEFEPRPATFQTRFAGDEQMMVFKDADMADDRFVRYHNEKFPFILQVQRYALSTKVASRGDTARIEIPPDAKSGGYLLW